MDSLSTLVGKRIRLYRQAKNLSLTELSNRIHKSKSTLSKYENGQISIDIETLFEIATILQVSPAQLIGVSEEKKFVAPETDAPKVHSITKKYMYMYDGRTTKIQRSYIEIQETGEDYRPATLFYNVPSFDKYEQCKALYYGTVYDHNFVTNYSLQNQSNNMENVSMCIVNPFELNEYRYGMIAGISARNLLPVCAKFILSDNILTENSDLKQNLILSKEDIRLSKRFNMFVLDQMV